MGILLTNTPSFFLSLTPTPYPPPPHPHTLPPTSSGLNEVRLDSLGVFDGNHRRSILHKAQSGGGDGMDLDNVLTDLTSVIADLEAFTVVSHAVCPLVT